MPPVVPRQVITRWLFLAVVPVSALSAVHLDVSREPGINEQLIPARRDSLPLGAPGFVVGTSAAFTGSMCHDSRPQVGVSGMAGLTFFPPGGT